MGTRKSIMAYDAVVIGAGHNGLAAAVHLASKGWKVGVFEQHAEPGGAIKTREVTLSGFRHDICAMNLSLFAGSPFFAAHRDGLIRNGLEFVPVENCFATSFGDGTWLGVSKSLSVTTDCIAKLSRQDAATWQDMVAAFGKDAPHIFGLLGNPMPSWATAKVIAKAWRAMGTSWLVETLKLLASSPRAFLDQHFESDKLKATLAAWGLHLDFSPDIAGGALFPYLEAMANQCFGMVIGKGGADTVTKALTGYLKELGGELHLGSDVAGIETSNNRVTGIRLSDGRHIEARKAVIANLHPHQLFGRLLANAAGPEAVAKKMKAFRPGPGTMMVHFALSDLPPWRASDELKSFAYVHIAPSLDAMSRVYQDALAGLIPEEPVLVVGQPTALDPSRAPPGKHVLWVQVRVLPAEVKGDAAGKIEGAAWDVIKEQVADRVVAVIDRHAPGFKNAILARSVFSPADLERENPNLVGGDNLTGSHHLSQNFLFRPIPGWSRYKMPIEGLWLVGAATWPGAGVGAGSGFLAAKMLAG
jgi:phytoene dehydrogenase-like protein